MDNSPPESVHSMPEPSSADLPPPERRSVRRKLVQSTLFPPTPQPQDRDETGHGKAERDRGDENGDNVGAGAGEDEDCGGSSQSKRKRKPRAKATPTKRSSEKSKGKRSCNTTPKKNLEKILNEEAPVVIPNLRLEAKITAEENSRMFAGRQVHPFFSSCKTNKKNQDVTEIEGNQFASRGVRKETNCGPIHVFEKTQDNEVSIDWKAWKFHEGIFANSSFSHESMCSSIPEASAECLSFDKLAIMSHPRETSIPGDEFPLYQRPIQDESAYETPVSSQISEDANKLCYQALKAVDDREVKKVDSLTEHISGGWKPDVGQGDRLIDERMKAYYSGCGDLPRNCLWTYKYQPKKAIEVCGNDESVKLLSEWLQNWHGRDFQISKDINCDVGELQDKGYMCSESDSDTENKHEEGGLKNVLLVSGPVGSGKSAAIYACARELGFEVLEVSASECRNGALVRQRFGEALESRHLKSSLAKPVCSPNKLVVKPSTVTNDSDIQESDDTVVELISLSDDVCHNGTGGSRLFGCREAGTCCHQSEVKPLILFEDVDINFLEDRGFIGAIQQISETAKGPIILTSNSHDPLLPENLDREQIYFAAPSSEDLLGHVYMVCAAESAKIQTSLLEQLIGFCDGDIRKAIMHLQFWCQGKSIEKASKIKRPYGSQPFDLEAGHRILPKLMPWGLPSQLSALVDREITQSLSKEDDASLMEVIEEEDLDQQETYSSFMHNNDTESIDAKKAAMLSRNCYINDYDQCRGEPDNPQEFSDNSDAPFSCFRRNGRKQHELVLSSDSEDELADNGFVVCPQRVTNNETIFEGSPSLIEIPCSAAADMNEQHCHCMETESFIPITDECKSLDVSCVPESSFVPETVISYGAEVQFTTRCGNYVDEEVSMSNGLLFETPNLDLSKANIQNGSKTLLDNHVTSEFCHQEEVEDSQNEQMEAFSMGYQLMDESSRMDYRRLTKYVEKPKPMVKTDLVQNSWNKLRSCRADLSKYVGSEEQHGLQIVNLNHQLSNLLSETDILVSRNQLPIDESIEQSFLPSEESDTFSLSDKLLLASTTAEHGFCYYAKSIGAVGSAIGLSNTVDLASEMSASLTGTMAFGKLTRQDIGTNGSSNSNPESCTPKSDKSFISENESTISDVLQSIVPSKSRATLKGPAFYEYLSTLRCISRSEASRLSQINENPKRRRKRGARHYLSTGALMLSPEEISSLGQINSHKDDSS